MSGRRGRAGLVNPGFSRSALPLLLLALALITGDAAGQSVLDRSPNLQGTWGLPGGRGAFIFSHRFELMSGGDEVLSVPTLTLAVGLPARLTAGLDFTTLSEAVPDALGGNEAQFWLKLPAHLGEQWEVALLAAYNTAASSVDGALDARFAGRRIQLFAEGRSFTNLFGDEGFQAGGAVGAGVRLTEYLALVADLGKVLTLDTIPAAWSAALAVGIPATPHTFTLQIANTGAVTLQGASREKTVGATDIRYGFSFTVPVGSPARWGRILDPPANPAMTSPDARLIRIEDFDYAPAAITIRAGEAVEWINLDAVAHTATHDEGAWGSPSLATGERFRVVFGTPGVYSYLCLPHPGMRGTITVTE